MYTVHERHLFVLCQLSGSLICSQHELLDNALSLAALTGLYIVADTVLTDEELAFRCLYLGSMTELLLGDELVRQLVHKVDILPYRGVLFRDFLGFAAVEDTVYLGIDALYP